MRSELWLEWNSTTTQTTRNKANGEVDDINTCKIVKLWLEWNSTTTQQTRTKRTAKKWRQNLQIYRLSRKWGHCDATELYCNDHREANDDTKRRQIRRIFGNTRENEEYHGTCGWSCASTTTQETGEKPSWNVCSNGHDTDMMYWQYAGLRVRSKSSGLPVVGVSKTIHVSKSRPF